MCIFCKIINGEIPSNPVFENDDFIVVNDLYPKAKTHLLLIPKLHIDSISHLENEHSDIIGNLFLLARDIAKERGIDGYKLQFNVGKGGGQEIMHIHLHFLAN